MAQIQIGQTVNLIGSDSGLVEEIHHGHGGAQYRVNINGESHWVKAAVISEFQCAQQQTPSCHYCGMPATDWDGFNAPVCSDCR